LRLPRRKYPSAGQEARTTADQEVGATYLRIGSKKAGLRV